MAIGTNLIDQLLVNNKKPEDIIGKDGLLKQLTKALLERALHAELNEHVDYEKHSPLGNNSGNSRNGATTKTLKGDFGEIELDVSQEELEHRIADHLARRTATPLPKPLPMPSTEDQIASQDGFTG